MTITLDHIIEEWDKLTFKFIQVMRKVEELLEVLKDQSSKLNDIITLLESKYEKRLIEDQVMESYGIRDTNTHYSKFTPLDMFDVATIYVSNELDADIEVTVYGNWTESTMGAVRIGDSFTVPANSVDARNINIYSNVWMPYSFVSVRALTTPTKGVVHIKYIKRVG